MKKRIKTLAILMVIGILLLLTLSSAYAAIPNTINYQGYLTDSGGNPKNGPVTMKFSLYTVLSGGTAFWTETQSVTVNNGVYNVILGSVNQTLGNYNFDVPYFLGVTVGIDAEMTPRQPLTSVGYAFTADNALSVAANGINSAMIQDGTVSSADVNFNYAGSTSKGGPATDLACAGCVSSTELNFIPGDITSVNTAVSSGLTGGSTSGDVNLNVNFAGSGSANTVARSDHNHDATYVNVGESSSITSGMIQDGAIMNADINASAAIVGSKLASDGSVMKSLIAGTNVTVNNNNNGSWTVNSTGGGSGWSLTGNSGTNPTINFVGTTDNQAFEVRVNNTRAMRMEPNATSPNIIGGYSGNIILSGAVGATISGGGESGNINTITDNFGTIGGGTENISGSNDGFSTNSLWTTVGGGNANIAGGGISTVGGGQSNTASGLAATVAGGYSNFANAASATVGGGSLNTVNGDYSTIGGGLQNSANAKYATISGGGITNPADVSTRNRVTDDFGTIGGGGDNQAGNNTGTTDDAGGATVGGGWHNRASGYASTVGGGAGNVATSFAATVGGGGDNFAIGERATVSGGILNYASGLDAAIGGGYENHADNEDAIVGGGFQNTANGPRSTVGGGYQNQATNNAATVPGGANNLASGGYSFAAGAAASAIHTGSFVWSSAEGTSSFGNNTFTVRAHGGVAFYTSPGTGTGCIIASGGSDCAGGSDRNIKENYADVDSKEILETLMTLPIQTWNYKSQSPTIRHIGPVAQDLNSMFAYLFNEVESPVHVNKMDEIGISFAAIQGLYHILKEKDTKIKEQDARIEKLEKVIAEMERRLAFIEAPTKTLVMR